MTAPDQRYDGLFKVYAEWDQTEAGEWVMRKTMSLDWMLLKAQAKAESGLRPRAVSPAGAMGLFQFMPATWEEWNRRKYPKVELDIYNPEHSTFLAAAYMEHLLGRYAGNMRKALAAYNFGMGNVDKAIALRGDAWETGLPAETAGYLVKVLG